MEKSENTEVELLKSELAAEKAEKFEAIKEFLTVWLRKLLLKVRQLLRWMLSLKAKHREEKPLKGEIHEVLNEDSRSKLKKSDRDAINAFYLNGQSTLIVLATC